VLLLWCYLQAKTHVWAQEEGSGHGAWSWMDAHFAGLKANGKAVNVRLTSRFVSKRRMCGWNGVRADVQLTYAGRPSMAQPAVGLSKRNKVQGDHIFAQLFPSA
jgi:2-oxoglutarate dehydrogenase complex dehydrogenase (E1) component-like enzyme